MSAKETDLLVGVTPQEKTQKEGKDAKANVISFPAAAREALVSTRELKAGTGEGEAGVRLIVISSGFGRTSAAGHSGIQCRAAA